MISTIIEYIGIAVVVIIGFYAVLLHVLMLVLVLIPEWIKKIRIKINS